MKKNIQAKTSKTGRLYKSFTELVAVGTVTGIFAGIIVTFFNILAHKGEEISQNAYAYVRNNPLFIPVLLLTLFAGAFLIGVIVQMSKAARGCGIPQAEGGIRGIVKFHWFRDMTAMFAASLLGIFMGLSIGAEGPSALIGACTGDGVSVGLRRDNMIRKYQLTGGACAGLAVASNAPLTGMAFAFEEAHKRFTPEVFICAFTSVIFAMLTKSLIYQILGMQIENAFHSYIFYEMPIKYYGYVLLAGITCGVLGVVFYKSCIASKKLFGKIRIKNPRFNIGARIMIAVLIGGIFSFISIGAMGGGHELIESLGTYGGMGNSSAEGFFKIPLVWALLVALLVKMFVTSVNVGSGMPCGIFIPIIAIGACIGGVLNQLWLQLGMEDAYCDIMVMICMAAFFTTIVKAPITAIVMICEFTGSFAPLLPVIIGVFCGYLIGELSRTDGIYDELLEIYEHEYGLHENAVREIYTMSVAFHSIAEGREVRDVLWPAGARVSEIARGEDRILPDGDTVLRGGDVLTIVCKTNEPQKVKEELAHILG